MRRPRRRSRPRLLKLFAAQNGRCHYCGRRTRIKSHDEPHRPDHATLDHVVPVSRGGTWHAANLVMACYGCNNAKKNNLLSEWSRP